MWHSIWYEWHIQQLSEDHEHIICKDNHHSHTDILKCFLLSETVLNCSYNDTVQVWKEWLHHIQNLKTDSSAKHDRKDNQDHNDNTSEINDESAQHAIRTTDERTSKSLYKNSIRSAN